jgi:hypothetical protein
MAADPTAQRRRGARRQNGWASKKPTASGRARTHDEPLAGGAGFTAVINAPAGELLREFARMTAGLMSRTARLLAVGEAAATVDPALREFRDRGHSATRADLLAVADALSEHGELARASPSSGGRHDVRGGWKRAPYLRLLDECGCSDDDYAQLLERLLSHLVN